LLVESVRIATEGNLSELSTLKWIQGLEAELNQLKIAGHHKLTKAEQELIKSAAGPILK
jgi:hypothetical protein